MQSFHGTKNTISLRAARCDVSGRRVLYSCLHGKKVAAVNPGPNGDPGKSSTGTRHWIIMGHCWVTPEIPGPGMRNSGAARDFPVLRHEISVSRH